MNRKIKLLTLLMLAIVCIVIVCSCDEPPYTQYDKDGYNVSVKFDSNGGSFGEKCYTIVDCFNIESLPLNENGMKEIYLVETDSTLRESSDQKPPQLSNYIFAGWFKNRVEMKNEKGEALDCYGVPVSISKLPQGYTYSDKWDFDEPLEIDPSKEYSSYEPVMTLYAAWIPYFRVQYYDYEDLDENGNPKHLGDYYFNQKETTDILLPSWDEKTGKLNYNKGIKLNDKTFVSAYYNGNEITDSSIKHQGTFDMENASWTLPSMDIQAKYKDGEWYKITNARQLTTIVLEDDTEYKGIYEILADLDFLSYDEEGNEVAEIWPFADRAFTGKILGNGHKISNVYIEQTNPEITAYGLFAKISGATIEDITFENATMMIKGGINLNGTSFGLLAGVIENRTVTIKDEETGKEETTTYNASLSDVSLVNGKIYVDSRANFGLANDYQIGLMCGNDTVGAHELIDFDVTAELYVDEDGFSFESVSAVEISEDGQQVIIVLTY